MKMCYENIRLIYMYVNNDIKFKVKCMWGCK